MFYTSVIKIKHGYQPKLTTCKDKQGIIAAETEVMSRWTKNCQELLNKKQMM
jgi:hypothetical protein